MRELQPTLARSTKQQQRVNQIVDVAADVFRRKGYDAATLDEIAETLGVRKASLYRYIDSKEDLLYAVIETALHRLIETNSHWQEENDILEQIRRFLEDHVTAILDNIDHISVYFADLRALPPRRRAVLQALADEYTGQLEHLVRKAVASGAADPSSNPVLATHGLFGIVNYAHRWYRPGRGISRTKVVAGLAGFAVASLGARPT